MAILSRLVRAAARLPPRLGVLLALICLAVFHAVAGMAPPAAIDPQRLRSVAVLALVQDLAGGLQWGLPVVFLTWALASKLVRRTRPRVSGNR